MAWDSTKISGDIIVAADWNAMVTDQKSRIINAGVTIFEDADTTPTVVSARMCRTANTETISITNFDNGVDGQEIVIQFNDNYTTIANNATIKLQGGQNFTASQYDQLSLSLLSTVWIEGGRSLNS